MSDPRPTTRVLSDLRHGGHALSADLYKAALPVSDALDSVSRIDEVVDDPTVSAATDEATTPFGYLFVDLQDGYPAFHLPTAAPSAVVVGLKALGAAMVDDQPDVEDPGDPAVNATVPPIYTYWGQFIDHDITANTDRDKDLSITDNPLAPELPEEVVASLRNLREPALNLDSLYGDGPFAPVTADSVPYDGIRFVLGTLSEGAPGAQIPPVDDLARDLPRHPGSAARIGDGRNDENLIIAQLHVAFLRFHNAVVDWVEDNEPAASAEVTFARARDLVRWHYQWLVVHDFLATIALPGAAEEVLASDTPLLHPRDGAVYMPLEFSVAAFRFGHSMVRAAYDHNRNFGDEVPNQTEPGLAPRASFEDLFRFTGNGQPPFRGFGDTLPDNWPIEWDRFTERNPASPVRLARKIDTRLAPPLKTLLNEGNDPALARRIRDIVKRLAVRNLLRGYKLAIPTGQDVATTLGVPALTTAQLDDPATPRTSEALVDGGFLTATPLWFYVLKEAEVLAQGDSLGPVGSRIVCETLVGQIRLDPTSYLNQPGDWDPAQGVTLPGGGEIRGIADLLRFAGVLV